MDLQWRDVIRLRLRALFRRRRAEQELNEELQFHLDHQIEEYVSSGVPADEARTLALRKIGTLDAQRELCRDARGVNRIDHILRDLRGTVRLLSRDPGFTAIAVLSLALGIGANATIFQLLDAVRLRPLPVSDANRLAIVDIQNRVIVPDNYSGRYAFFTSPLFDALQARSEPFDGLLAWNHATMDLTTRGESHFVENGLFVSGNFFDVLGVRAERGRLLAPSDDTRACNTQSVVLSHAFWQHEYGGSASVLGATLTLNAKSFTVIGVTPEGFYGVEVGRSFDLAVPLCAEAIVNPGSTRRTDPASWWLGVMGRLKPGWSLDRASSYLSAESPALFAATLPPTFSADDQSKYLAFRLGASRGSAGFSLLRQQYNDPLWLLLGVAGVVLLIACANVANLLLARMSARDREMAVRLAIGASRGRLIQQLLIESLVLATIGTALGALIAQPLGRLIVSLVSSDVNPMFVDLAPDWRVVGFLAMLGLMTTLLFGLAPAVRASRVPPGSVMKNTGRGLVGTGSYVLRKFLVAGQVALSLVLLVVGLLFARSLINLVTTRTGFAPSGILEADVDMRPAGLAGPARAALRDDLVRRLTGTPGVAHVATVASVPFVGNWWRNVYLQTHDGWKRTMGRFNRVSPAFFETVGTPLLQGRDFDAAIDVPSSERVAIVNQAFVRKNLDGLAPIGLAFRLEGAKGGEPGTTSFRIIGIAGDTKHGSLREEFEPIVYVAESQLAEPSPFLNIFIRPRASAGTAIDQIRTAIALANDRIVFHFHDVARVTLESIAQDRLMALLCGAFAVLGAVLATIGVYGVVAYAVARRRAEIGVRLALGAGRSAIIRLIIGQAAGLVAAGVVIGVITALAGSRVMTSLLYQLTPADPLTYAAAATLLLSVALFAAYVPARRASRANPTVALREE